jgi:hypothetical protein
MNLRRWIRNEWRINRLIIRRGGASKQPIPTIPLYLAKSLPMAQHCGPMILDINITSPLEEMSNLCPARAVFPDFLLQERLFLSRPGTIPEFRREIIVKALSALASSPIPHKICDE